MKLHIKKDISIGAINKEFNDYFPYLKIGFFKVPHITNELTPEHEKIDLSTPVNRLVNWNEDKVLEINEKMTVGQFESMISQQAGLFVQVFRQSGRLWIQTSHTDDWTLKQQNEQGKIMSNIHYATSKKQEDWEAWDAD